MVKVSNMSTNYVDRDEASEILKVSTRTVDRYIRKFKFKTRKDGRRVLIKKDDLNQMIQEQIGQFVDLKRENLSKSLESEMDVQNATSIAVKDIKVEAVKKTEKDEREEAVYKTLYTDTKKELKERQDRLEAATYRVGQLEAQLNNMVPLLDFSQKEKELKEAKYAIEQKEVEKVAEINKMEHKLRNERLAKWVYLSLVGILLVVEPILFLLWAFS